MNAARFLIAASLTALLAACAMPQPPSPSLPGSSGSSGSQGSQGSSQGSSGSSGSQGSQGSAGSQGASGSQGSAGPSGSASAPGSAGGGVTVGEQLPWPSADVGVGGDGGLDDAFEDSLGDFDEAIAGGAGAGGPDEEIDILNPMGESSSGTPSDEPLFEEGDLGDEGDTAENESIAQRAASGSSSSSGGGQEGGGASGAQSGSEQSQSQNSAATGGSGGGGAGAQQGDRSIATTSSGGAEQGGEDIIPIPDDIGEGRNDDIVLRQIREAAMNERDPVLREKLWDEYRRIKGSR